ncbi:TonB-dependent receptor domain-containing protein [Lutibacter holmesii]|uniref:TonB-dependent receptor domain-containing protein n=1 Tax=Lutibacter holmesii TaxID=1137985 RepID=A0ABW3WN55_9FLAO
MKNIIGGLLLFLMQFGFATEGGVLKGKIIDEIGGVPGVTVQIKNTSYGTTTNSKGEYSFTVPSGELIVVISSLGFKTVEIKVKIETNQEFILNKKLEEDVFGLDQIVVTGTKTFKRQTQSPIIVSVIDSQMLTNVQACNLSEGLKFQPGLRVETDCQTCNYTQLRMNGLAGGYSQILINGRPVFSPLTGLYGLEQIPQNMIERIEVVRGGGSALYGSSAIGGTVNVLTKVPKENYFNVGYTFQSIDGSASDHMLNGNATLLTKNENAGVSFFISQRNREYYDANDDNFSELPELKNDSYGINMFFLPTENQKIELSLTSMNEYRYGGEMVDGPPHFSLQAEERTHNVLVGTLDYQLNFNEDNSSFITYMSAQKTDRDHYTGIRPELPEDSEEDILNHYANPPYGISEVSTWQAGAQLNHRFLDFLHGENVVTAGLEYVDDVVYDEIEAYNYLIDQKTTNFGMFLQSDWEISNAFNLLLGIRGDKHNLLDNMVFSPRVSMLYKLKKTTQFRLTWGTGFRAPQAFDTDLHIAFAGGGVSRISLSPNLQEEKSSSFSGSVNYDKSSEKFIAGFTVEGFYTHLKDAFYLEPIGSDDFGLLYEKRNGDGAIVKGGTIELRGNYNKKVQLELGLTAQSSKYDSTVSYSETLEPTRKFLRTPNVYGYSTLTYTPTPKFNASLNMVYTGSMEIVHLAGAPEQEFDAYVTSNPFTELSFKAGYIFEIASLGTGLEFFGGIKNVLNAYQSDFDSGKNRDSNYVYGPAMPRTYFMGVKIGSF